MEDTTLILDRAAHDAVGRYRQDEVNGFTDEFLDRFLDRIRLAGGEKVLDAMAGDGNLTQRLLDYCRRSRTPSPDITVIEYSRVQSEFARAALAGLPVQVVWGDAVAMADRATGEPLPEASFDRVVIKSANHEVPLDQQARLYESVYRVLKPGGLFVNLGLLFDDPKERAEFREVARVKDTLAGMVEAAKQRHFLTREELYSRLAQAGFVDVTAAEAFDYRIDSAAVARNYFSAPGMEGADAEHQAIQAKSMTLRSHGRLRFDGASSLMILPGEITVARRPTWAESNAAAFRHCPYDFLRHLECHAQLLDKTVAWVPRGAAVLDLGSGPGLLADRLVNHVGTYRGVEISPEFVAKCRGRLGSTPGFAFEQGDIGQADFGEGKADVVTLLNVLYLPGIDPVQVLKKAHAALRAGGRLIVSGPTSTESYRKAEPFMRAQLERDGLLETCEPLFRAVGEANDRLLPNAGNYWSIEGMIELLKGLGFRAVPGGDTQIYYGHAFLVVAEK